jgi:hypothetical protein
MVEATVAYQGVLSVLVRAVLQNPEDEHEDDLVLTYSRFTATLGETKRYLLTINS